MLQLNEGVEDLLTPEELKALLDLQSLADRWPESLWLWSDGTIEEVKTERWKADGRIGQVDLPPICFE